MRLSGTLCDCVPGGYLSSKRLGLRVSFSTDSWNLPFGNDGNHPAASNSVGQLAPAHHRQASVQAQGRHFTPSTRQVSGQDTVTGGELSQVAGYTIHLAFALANSCTPKRFKLHVAILLTTGGGSLRSALSLGGIGGGFFFILKNIYLKKVSNIDMCCGLQTVTYLSC